MTRVWYGNINNRIEEGRNYNKDKTIHEGDDITMYYWSDRKCYFVTKVISQKHIFVHRYHVCADHSKEGGMGHQNWLYFKTCVEERKYLNDCIDKGLISSKYCEKKDLSECVEGDDEEWVFRYGKWRQVARYTKERWERCLAHAKEECSQPDSEERVHNLARWMFGLDDEGFRQVMQGEEVVRYFRLDGEISFGVRDYYYDWEF